MHVQRGGVGSLAVGVCAWWTIPHAWRVPRRMTYLARNLPHPVTAPAEPLMSVYICMRSLHGKFCFSAYIVHSGKLVLNSVPQVDRHHQYDLQCRSAAVFTPMSTLLVIFIENIATLLYKTSHL